jgi:hypothetical protein
MPASPVSPFATPARTPGPLTAPTPGRVALETRPDLSLFLARLLTTLKCAPHEDGTATADLKYNGTVFLLQLITEFVECRYTPDDIIVGYSDPAGTLSHKGRVEVKLSPREASCLDWPASWVTCADEVILAQLCLKEMQVGAPCVALVHALLTCFVVSGPSETRHTLLSRCLSRWCLRFAMCCCALDASRAHTRVSNLRCTLER